MKVSLQWLREYLDVDLPTDQIGDILTEIGLEVEGLEEVESIKGSLAGLLVGNVMECGKHPNADRLSLCQVDIGSEVLSIVCGAPNVAAGQKVVVAPVGTILFDAEGKPWKIKRGKIRGEMSQGMICAEDEIGLGTDHSGIMVLPDGYEVGQPLNAYIDTGIDQVFDIGLTPNRSDATCHVGVARDLAAALKINYDMDGDVRHPSVDEFAIDSTDNQVKVEVLENEGCPRYAGLVISGIKVEESPDWLKTKLRSIGVRAINNIVDITNFVLHELGQPLHAFDLDKIQGRKIKVQTLPESTRFISLDEQERKLSSQDLMICDGQDKGMCIAGVFGGIDSGVSETTNAIFLESAHFDAKWIRRSSSRHLLYTDAARVFEKGSDPNICVYALKRAALLIKEIAGGSITSDLVDIYPRAIMPTEISLSFRRLNRLVGTEIAPEQVFEILRALQMTVIETDEDQVTVQIPTNKADVKREADLIEEVLRIYGYNKVPIPDRMSFSVARSPVPDRMKFRNKVADLLCAYGLNEIMGLSMVDRKYVDDPMFHLHEDEVVRINNTSNIQMEVMRPNLFITALETVLYNQNRQQSSMRLFEFGKSYRRGPEGYLEQEHLVITVSGWGNESWLQPTLKSEQEYFALKSLVSNVLEHMGISLTDEFDMQANAYFEHGVECKVGNNTVVKLGEIAAPILGQMDIRNKVFVAEFDWNVLISTQKVDSVVAQEPSRFPEVRRDLALVIDKGITFEQLEKEMHNTLGSLAKEINLFDVFEKASVIGEGKKSYAVSMILSNPKKTFSEKELENLMNRVIRNLESEVGAKLR